MWKDNNPLILVPVAIVTGLFLGVLAGTVAALLAWAKPWLWALSVFAIGGAVAWLLLLYWWQRVIEAQNGMTSPEPAVTYRNELRLSVDWDEGRGGLFDDLSVDDATFIAWGCSVARGTSLGENHWTGQHNPFSKGQYHKFLDRLEFQGIVRRAGRSANSPYELTGKGRAIVDELLRRYGGNGNSPAKVAYLQSGRN